MEEPNVNALNGLARLKVDDFLHSVEIVRSQVFVQTFVMRTTYGSRVFIRIKKRNSTRCILKTVIKVSNNKDLDSLGTFLDSIEKICLSYY